MTRVALVGYRFMPESCHDGDLVTHLPSWISHQGDLKVCSTEFVEQRSQSIDQAVAKMLQSNPEVLVYTNYRDYITNEKDDEEYIALAKRHLPVLLLSGAHKAADFAKSQGIDFIRVPMSLQQLFCRIRELGDPKYTNIDNAVENIILLTSKKKKPITVGIYGIPNHGKSWLSEQFSRYSDLAPTTRVYITNSDDSLPHYDIADYYLVNVPISAPDDNTFLLANKRVAKAVGKPLDFNVLVFNPLMYRKKVDWTKIRTEYDLIVINEKSVEKKLQYNFKQS